MSTAERGHNTPTDGRPDTDFEAIAARAPDIIYRFRVRPTPGFEYVSPAATALTGYTPEEHYADPELGLKIVHEDDRPLLLALLAATPQHSIVLRWLRKDGTVVWTEQRNTPVYDDHGELLAIEGIAREIADPTLAPRATVRVLGDLRLDLHDQRAYVSGRVVHLTPTEFRLLALLTSRPGQTFSRRTIMKHLWRSMHDGRSRACEVHISALRRKIEPEPRPPQRIKTIRGKGYAFIADQGRAILGR